MRRLLFLVFLLIYVITADAQRSSKNELGIGVGSLEYISGYQNKTFFFYTQFTAVAIPNPFFYQGSGGYLITKSCSTPSIHFTRSLASHLLFQLNYQYAYAKGVYYDLMYGTPESSSRTFTFNYHQSQFGFNTQLFKKKQLNPYLGIGFQFNMSASILHVGHRIEKYYNTVLMPYTCLGMKLHLNRQFSMQYDATLITDSEILIAKPLNRLSLNYHF